MGGVQSACLPPGWSARRVTLSHCSAGRATSGVWSLVAWYPPFFEVPTPLPVVTDMWFPLWCYVNYRKHASPHIGKQPGVVAMPAVVRSEGLVQLCGLFPASDRFTRVLVPATSSPTGLGSRSLSFMELGGLWDIPISVMDSLVGPAAGDIYMALFDTPPTKTLLVGADSLLTTSFRGGLQGSQDSGLQKRGKGGGNLGVTLGPHRKRAHSGTPNSLGVLELPDLSHFALPGLGLPGPVLSPGLPGPVLTPGLPLVWIRILGWQPHSHWSHSIQIF